MIVQTAETLPLSTGHTLYDMIVGLVVVLMSLTKVVEWLRIWGFLPESQRKQARNGNGLDSIKYMSSMTVDVWEQRTRHLIRNELTIAIGQISKSMEDQNELLGKIYEGIIKMVTLLDVAAHVRAGKP